MRRLAGGLRSPVARVAAGLALAVLALWLCWCRPSSRWRCAR
jgi:hypothetical protein